MKKRLYLCHAQGRYGENCYVPLSVGCLWAYARTFKEIDDAYEMVDFLYLKEPIETAVARLEDPSVLGLAHYVWNAEWNKAFARAVKQKFPNCTIIVGGVQVPDESPRVLQEHPDFDFAIYGEGEGAFADFLREHAGQQRYWLCGSLIWKSDGEVHVNERREFTDLAELRSPYLDGVFDELWKREPRWQVLQETSRGCPYASFSGDTLVHLPDRIICFEEEIYSDQHTLPCPDHGHRHRVGQYDDRLVSQGLRDCIRLTLSNGLPLTVTPNHPMIVVRGEQFVDVRASELKVGDWIPIEVDQNAVTDYVTLAEPAKTRAEILAAQGIGQGRRCPELVQLPTRLTEEVAWLTGYLIGDGCLPTDDRPEVLFAVTDSTRVMLRALIANLFGLSIAITDSKFTNKMQNGVVHSRKVVQFFRESLGIKSGDAKLMVPRLLFRSPRHVVRAFLDGLWSADGHRPQHGESYLTTVSERLARECASLIHWIGDAAVVRSVKTRPGVGTFVNTKSVHYRVEWHGDRCRERRHGKPCVASRVPAIRHTYRDRKGVLRLRRTRQLDRVREGTPRAVLRNFEPEHVLLNRRFVYARVTSVVSAGKQETYDVHHHPEHKVAANGAYVRQCTFCAWGQAALTELRPFPEERVRGEIEWFGKMGVDYVDNADANYGIVKRDVEMTRHLAATKAAYGFPRTFRTSFAKNSNDTIWTIANILHEAEMLKSVTLAMQSMDDGVLVNIKRKNIKYSKFGELIARYEAAGIPTYTEIILGLPGETLDTFLDGIDRNLEAGQHSGLFCYLNIMLENTEQNTPGYIAAHGLETRVLQAMLTHGTPDDSVPREKQEIIVGTAAMPHANWRRGYLHMKVVEIFHSQGLLQDCAVAAHARGVRYRDFYSRLLDWCLAKPETVAGREVVAVAALLDRALAGGSWDCVDERLGDISWPPEEFAFARVCLELDKFYDEVEDFLLGQGVEDDEIETQRGAIARPWDDTVAWARQVVWYDRKGYARKTRKVAS